MANTDIYPFGQTQEMPAGYPIANDLDTNDAQQALSAAMGYKLARMGGGRQWQGKTWYAYGASLTEYGKYTSALASLSGMTCVNKGLGGQSICNGQHKVRDAIMNVTDGKTNADLITIELLGNEGSSTFGEVSDGLNADGTTPETAFDTILGCIVQSLVYLQQNTNAQIAVFGYTGQRYWPDAQHPLAPNTKYGGKTLAERRAMLKEVCDMYGIYYLDPTIALGWARQTNDYFSDNVHYTDLGGYVVAEYLWSKIKDIPLWRTAIPT